VDWPERSSVDPIAERARQLALNLREAIGQRSVREIASITGVDRATIGAVLQGKSWPDIVTLAKLEHELGSLWPAT
jgi:transcriptional regulator with XRE-family HTH domain